MLLPADSMTLYPWMKSLDKPLYLTTGVHPYKVLASLTSA